MVDNEEFDAVVLAMPGIQAARILENDEIANQLNKQNWASALSAWFVIDSDTPKYDAMFVNNHSTVKRHQKMRPRERILIRIQTTLAIQATIHYYNQNTCRPMLKESH